MHLCLCLVCLVRREERAGAACAVEHAIATGSEQVAESDAAVAVGVDALDAVVSAAVAVFAWHAGVVDLAERQQV